MLRGQAKERPHSPGSLLVYSHRISVQKGFYPPLSSLGKRQIKAWWGGLPGGAGLEESVEKGALLLKQAGFSDVGRGPESNTAYSLLLRRLAVWQDISSKNSQ